MLPAPSGAALGPAGMPGLAGDCSSSGSTVWHCHALRAGALGPARYPLPRPRLGETPSQLLPPAPPAAKASAQTVVGPRAGTGDRRECVGDFRTLAALGPQSMPCFGTASAKQTAHRPLQRRWPAYGGPARRSSPPSGRGPALLERPAIRQDPEPAIRGCPASWAPAGTNAQKEHPLQPTLPAGPSSQVGISRANLLYPRGQGYANALTSRSRSSGMA